MTTPQTPAGWYSDPDGSGGQRYWDGYRWTEHRAPAPPAPQMPAQQGGAHRKPESDDAPEAGQPPAGLTVSPPPQGQPETTTVIQTSSGTPVPEPAGEDSQPGATSVIPTSWGATPPPPPPPNQPGATSWGATPPPPPQPGATSWGAAPPQPPPGKSSSSLLMRYLAACAVLLAVLLGLVIYAAFFSGDSSETITATDDPTTPQTAEPTETTGADESDDADPPFATAPETTEPAPPTDFGEAADGPLSFVVQSVEFAPFVESPDAPVVQSAQGEYVIVRMTVTNVSDGPATFLGTFQKLEAEGTNYSIDDVATFFSGGGIAELGPGDQVDVGVVFDVPPGTTPDAIELHGDPLSPGVEVPLM